MKLSNEEISIKIDEIEEKVKEIQAVHNAEESIFTLLSYLKTSISHLMQQLW